MPSFLTRFRNLALSFIGHVAGAARFFSVVAGILTIAWIKDE